MSPAWLALVLTAPVVVPAPASPTEPWTAVAWQDGARARTAYVDPLLLAEVAPSDEGAAALRALDAAATVAGGRPRVRLWRVSDARALLPRLPAGFVWVLRDAKTTAAPMRVASGGVVLVFQPELSQAERRAWLSSRGLSARWLGSAVALVAAAPGRASLELAARLAKEPGLAAVTPNWWRLGQVK